MNADERRNLYQVYREEVRAMAYVYVEMIRTQVSALPPNVGDFTAICEPPQRLWPHRTYYPRTPDLFHEVSMILSREHKYCVKWRQCAPYHIYLRWVEIRDMATDIDDAPGAMGPPSSGFAARVAMPSTSSSGGDWLANLRTKLDKKK